MDIDTFRTCLRNIPRETVIEFAGFSEPFLNRDCVDMILLANDMGFALELFTTFVGISLDQLDKIADIPFTIVGFHTPDNNGYSNIKISDEYSAVIDKVLDMEKADGTSFVDIANCQSTPADELSDLFRNRLYIVSDPLCDRAGNIEEGGDLIKVDHRFGRIVCAASRLMDHWVLLPDGEVTLCNMDYGLKHVVGNLRSMTYDEIIKGKAFQEVISKMKSDDSDLICRDCFLSHSIDMV